MRTIWIPYIPGDGVRPPPSIGGRYTALFSPSLEEPRGSIGMDDRPHVLSLKGTQDTLGVPSVDNLELLEQSGMVEQIEQNTLERQRLQFALTQLRHGDLRDQGGRGVEFGISVIESVHVLY